MRKSILLALFCLALLFSVGCQNKQGAESAPPAEAIQFNLPEPYTVSTVDDKEYTVYRGEEAIGGIVLTGLNGGKIVDIDDEEFLKYLERFAPVPLVYEYFSMYVSDEELGCDYISCRLRITDKSKGEEKYYNHFLFEKGSECCDLWLVEELVTSDEKNALLSAVCG